MIGADVWREVLEERPRVKYIKRKIEVPRVKGRAVALIGPRRAGKTYLMYQTMDSLPEDRSFYVNFEDLRLVGCTQADLLSMYRVSLEMSEKGPRYYFLDEVQEVEGWERGVRFLLDRGEWVYVSGSSSKLLSQEVATQLRGRGIRVHVYPFSLREIYWPKRRGMEKRAEWERVLQKYLEWGGFPEVVLEEKERIREEILRDILETAVLKDIVERYGVREPRALKLILKILLHSPKASYSKIEKILKSLGLRTGKPTVMTYISYLKDAHIFFPLPPLLKSPRKRIVRPFKVCFVDNGFLRIGGVRDRGRLFENMVFSELLKLGFSPGETLFYLEGSNYEVDFVLGRPERPLAVVQASYSLEDPRAREREERGLERAKKELGVPGFLVTMENFWEFLNWAQSVVSSSHLPRT